MKRIGRSKFSGAVRLCPLPRVNVFEVKAEALEVILEREPGFLGVTIPVGGGFVSFDGRRKSEHLPAQSAHVLKPESDFRIQMPSSRVLVTNFNPPILSEFEAVLDSRAAAAVRAENPLLNLCTREGRSFLRYAHYMWNELNRESSLMQSPLTLRHLEGALFALFAEAIQPEESDGHGRRLSAPGKLVAAEEFMRANLGNPISVADIASAAGVSTRTLYRLFTDTHGTSPGQLLKNWRIEAVRDALEDADAGRTTVAEVALAHGFYHPSQFARDYHRAHGELPSATLRRRK